MAIDKVNDHAQVMLYRLPAQFRQAAFEALVGVLGERFQGIEDAAYALLSGRSIHDATGEQLVAIGRTLNAPRPTREAAATDDEAFRQYLHAGVLSNVSEGPPDDLITILRLLDSYRVQLVEFAYADDSMVYVRLAEAGDLVVTFPLAMDLLRKCAPAGVRLVLSGNEVWWPDRLWGDDDLWPEFRYTDGLWNPDGLWGRNAYWGGDMVA